MSFLRTYGKLVLLAWLSLSSPLLLVASTFVGPFLRRGLEDEAARPGSPAANAPSAYDMVPTAIIGEPRVPRETRPQTVELVMPAPKASAPIGADGRIVLRGRPDEV